MYQEYQNKKKTCYHLEFGYRCQCWERFYRCIYIRVEDKDEKQKNLFVSLPDDLIISNIGINPVVSRQLTKMNHSDLLLISNLFKQYHNRGNDELTHRRFKDFGSEQLPFKRFGANTAWYYLQVLSYCFFVMFQEEVLPVIDMHNCYASTVRRHLFDIGGRIVHRHGSLILRISRSCYNYYKLDKLFSIVQSKDLMTFAFQYIN